MPCIYHHYSCNKHAWLEIQTAHDIHVPIISFAFAIAQAIISGHETTAKLAVYEGASRRIQTLTTNMWYECACVLDLTPCSAPLPEDATCSNQQLVAALHLNVSLIDGPNVPQRRTPYTYEFACYDTPPV